MLVDKQGEITQRNWHSANFIKEVLDDGIELEMVSIPARLFQMGSPNAEAGSSEAPHHQVRPKSFLIGKYPITQAQWRTVATTMDKINVELDPDPSRFKGAKRPVERVSWHEAVEFCARLSKKTGRGYRLPSEAEWEYACRAGTTSPFHFGEVITLRVVNYNNDRIQSGSVREDIYDGTGGWGNERRQTTEVGIFPPNAFFLYDMHGNVWEWCADPWHVNYKGAPADGSVWEVGGDPAKRVMRGGGWSNGAVDCRSANRNNGLPNVRYDHLGFRVVRDA